MSQAICETCGKRGTVNNQLPDCDREDCPSRGFQRALKPFLVPVTLPSSQREYLPPNMSKVITECTCDAMVVHSKQCPSYVKPTHGARIIDEHSMDLWKACYVIRREKDFLDKGGLAAALADLFVLMHRIDLELDSLLPRKEI